MNLFDLTADAFMYHWTEVFVFFIVLEGKLILKQRVQAKVYIGNIMLLLDRQKHIVAVQWKPRISKMSTFHELRKSRLFSALWQMYFSANPVKFKMVFITLEVEGFSQPLKEHKLRQFSGKIKNAPDLETQGFHCGTIRFLVLKKIYLCFCFFLAIITF